MAQALWPARVPTPGDARLLRPVNPNPDVGHSNVDGGLIARKTSFPGGNFVDATLGQISGMRVYPARWPEVSRRGIYTAGVQSKM